MSEISYDSNSSPSRVKARLFRSYVADPNIIDKIEHLTAYSREEDVKGSISLPGSTKDGQKFLYTDNLDMPLSPGEFHASRRLCKNVIGLISSVATRTAENHPYFDIMLAGPAHIRAAGVLLRGLQDMDSVFTDAQLNADTQLELPTGKGASVTAYAVAYSQEFLQSQYSNTSQDERPYAVTFRIDAHPSLLPIAD